MPQASITQVFSTDHNTIFDVITNFEQIPSFEPAVTKIKVIENNGQKAKVVFYMKIMIHFKFCVWVDFSQKDYIHWELEEGKLFKKNSGHWKLKTLGPKETEVTYTNEVEINGMAPKFLIKKLIGQRLPEMMENYKKQCKKHSQNSILSA
ncbi:MAG: type II toxin-antitoxin system RatA family toxin [Bacteriovoracaceae bacterium]